MSETSTSTAATSSSTSPTAPSSARFDAPVVERRRTALVLAAHGSLVNPDSALATLDRLSEASQHPLLSRFDAVWPAFWKEDPQLPIALELTRAHDVVVVPVFVSEGYFAERVVPRELGLDGARFGQVQHVGPRRVVYARPIGTHPEMARVLDARIREVFADDGSPYSLVVVGHGTKRHPDSDAIVEARRDALAAAHPGRQVLTAYLDQDPKLDDVLDRCAHERVVVTPFFIAAGLHTREDIPEVLGLPTNQPGGPWRVGQHDVWLTEPAGTAPAVLDVIAARAEESLAALEGAPEPAPAAGSAARLFDAWLDEARLSAKVMGQIIVRHSHGRWDIRHVADRALPDDELAAATDPLCAVVFGRTGTDGAHRARSGSPTLQRGWRLELHEHKEVRRALDLLYPGALLLTLGLREPVPLEDTLARMKKVHPGEATLRSWVEESCIRGCTRHPSWFDGEARGDAPPCGEVCSSLLAPFKSARR